MSSVRVGREGLVSSGGRTLRAWRRRRRWRIGARARERNWWDVYRSERFVSWILSEIRRERPRKQ